MGMDTSNASAQFELEDGPLDGQLVTLYLTEDQPDFPGVIYAFSPHPTEDRDALEYPRTDGHYYEFVNHRYVHLEAVPPPVVLCLPRGS